MNTDKTRLPSEKLANKYVSQSLTELYQLTSKNQSCEAVIYLHSQTDQTSPQMYATNLDWESVLKNPFLVNLEINFKTQGWKSSYPNTVPMISLLICNLTPDSIYFNQNEVEK